MASRDLVLCLSLLLLSACVWNTVSQEEEEDGVSEEEVVPGSVVTLTKENFHRIVDREDIILVEFYAPWCGHCKKLTPEYESAAKTLGAPPTILLAKVDATVETELATEYGIQGYPTLKVFRKGVPYDYDGPRNANGIVEYMLDQARPDWSPPADEVLVLTKENFTEVVFSAEIILVEFYAPWCGHCKQLAPEYMKAAADLKPEGIPLAKVDATAETALAQQYNVTGYPTLFVFRKGIKYEYNGGRERLGIVNHMIEEAKPPIVELKTVKEAKKLVRSEFGCVIGFFAEEGADELMNTYTITANMVRGIATPFGFTKEPEVAKAFGIKRNTIAAILAQRYKTDYEQEMTLADISDVLPTPEDLLAWIKSNVRPLVGERTARNGAFLYLDIPLLVIYTGVKGDQEGFDYWMHKYLPLAARFRDRGIIFAISDDEEFAQELDDVGLGDWGEDVAACLWTGTQFNPRYPMLEGDAASLEDLEEFLEAFLDDRLQPYLKSQIEPKKQTGPVKVVVASTLNKIVFDPTKDVLLEVYAPWCGHCKALEPVYKKLAERYKNVPGLVIAKIDGTANDLPEGLVPKGFPVIFFVPAVVGATPEQYQGERTLGALAEFLKEKATRSLGHKDEL